MPQVSFSDIISLPKFKELPFEKKAEVAGKYWKTAAQEEPPPTTEAPVLKLDASQGEALPPSYHEQQFQDSMRFLTAQEKLKNASPIQARLLTQELQDSATALAVRQNVKDGKMTFEEGAAFAQKKTEERAAETEALKKTASLFDPKVEEQMQPAWKSLEKSAVNGQYFDEQGTGTKLYNAAADILPGGQSYDKTQESRKFYEEQRNKLAEDFNLQPDEVDDLVRHRLGKQKDPISRDAAGTIHIKDELLVKPGDELSKSIESSNLSPSTKKQALVEAPFKIAQFKEGVVQNVQKNHPELASDIKFTGDVTKDYASITNMLNDTRTEQFGAGVVSYGLGRVKYAALAPGGTAGVAFPGVGFVGESNIGNLKAAEIAQNKQESLNQISLQINQDKVKIFGTDAATVGQGVASMAESMVVAAATGGAGNALISADRIAKAGKVGAALLKFGHGAANIAPTAGIYGVDQGLSTYEQAMSSSDPAVRARAGELALKSGLIEAGVTTLFGGFGAGGAETMAQRLASGEARREAAVSLKQAWRNLGKNLVEVPFEEAPEETLITALDSVHVQKQLNPDMTDADVKKAVYDTMVSTLITTAPMGVFNVAKEARHDFSKKTHEQTDDELHSTADSIYKNAAQENIPETKTATGTIKAGGVASMADIERARSEQIALTEDPEEKQALAEATPEELAAEWGVKLKRQLTPQAVVRGASQNQSALLRKKEGREPMPGEAQSISDAPQELTKNEQEELDFLESNPTPEALADFYGVELKAPTVVSEKVQNEKQADPPLPGETPVADTPVGEVPVSENDESTNVSTASEKTDSIIERTAPGEERVAAVAKRKAAAVEVAKTIKKGDKIVTADGEVLVAQQDANSKNGEVLFEGYDEPVDASIYLTPDVVSINGVRQELDAGKIERKSTTPNQTLSEQSAPSNETPTPNTNGNQKEAGQKADAQKGQGDVLSPESSPAKAGEDVPATAENALAEIAKLVAVVPEGIAQPTATAPKLVQGTLFQSPEPQGDPNAIKLVRSYKGSPPKGATRALIDYAGEPLLSDLGDLPSHTVRDIKEADQIIQETTGKNGKAKLGRVGLNAFLSKLWKRHHRGKSPGWHNFQSRRDIREMGKILSFEIAHALSKDGSGVDWYRAKIDGMYEELALDYPELAKDGEERFLFSIMLAVTSNGQPVLENLKDTIALYERMRGTNRLPKDAKTSRSERGAAVQKAFREINALLDEDSWQDVKKELLTPITVSNLKKKYGQQITGELADHTVIGAMILGPKIGSFWGNLNGHYDSVTMDLWFTRTMNRLSGDTATINPEGLAANLKTLGEMPGLPVDVYKDIKKYVKDLENSEKSWVRVPSDIREELEHLYGFVKKTYGQYASSGFTDRSDFNKIVQKIVKEIDGGEDTPDNGTHRKWMRTVVEAAQSELQKAGVKLTNADLQAILWFHEKDLYTRFGATTNRGERTDYHQAAAKLSGKAGSETQRTSDPGGREDAGAAGQARQGGLLSVPQETRKEMEARLEKERGGRLYQNDENNKGFYQPGVRGAAQATIGFFDSADASTGVHEYWHDLAENDFFGILTPEEVKTIRDWETDASGKRDPEKGARGWERFLFEGTSTGFAEVDAVLSKLAEWLRSIYQGITNSSLNVEITPEVRAIMEKLVTRAARGEKVVVTPTRVVRETPAAAKPKKKIPKLRSMPSSTSIKNAETDKILAAAGLPEIMAPARKANEESWDEAMRSVHSNPDAGKQLVDKIVQDGRSVKDEVEEGVLLHETAIRKAAVVRARAALDNNPGDADLVSNLKKAQAALYDVIVADKLAGTAWGRIGQFRQRSIKEDFTLEAMEARFRADVNEGAPLSGSDSKYIAELQKRITEAEEKTRKMEEQFGQKAREADALIKKLEEKRAAVRAPSREGFVDRVKEKATAARAVLGRFARLSQKPEGRLHQSPEDSLTPDELEAFAAVGAEYLANGAKDLDSFTAKLTEEFPGSAPFAEQIFKAAQGSFKATATTSRAKTPIELKNLLDKENPQISNKLIYNMARGFINQGLEGRDVLDAVTKLLNEDFPDLTREEVVEAFTGYGKVKYPSKEEDLVKLRELRNIERIQRQIDDVRQGLTPKKTGQQRDAATLKIRELKKELQEAMRAMGIKHAVNKNQLRGALDAIKSRYKNEIEELEESIRTKTKRKERRSTLEYDDEIKALKAKRDKLKADYDNTFGVSRKAITEQQRVKAAVKSLTKRIAEEEAMLKAGILERVKAGSRTTLTPEIVALRTKLDGLRAAREKAREALHPKRTPEERALARALSAAQKSIDRYNAVLSGTPVAGKTSSPLTPNAALNALWSQRNALRKAVEQLRKASRPRLSADEKARRQAVAQLDKSIREIERRIATGDFSIKPKSAGRAAGFPDVIALKAQRNSLQAAFDALKKAALPGLTAEEKKDNALIRAANSRRAKIETRIASNDYVKVERVTPVMSTKLAAARLAESKAKEEWNRGFFEAELAKRSKGKIAYDTAVETLNFTRTMKTIADVSAVLRQGAVTAISHPLLSLRAIPGMFRAGLSEVQSQRIKNEIEAHPHFALSQQAKLFLSDTGPDHTLAKIEEAFRGRWAKNIPGVGKIVNFSERTYNAYLNSVRMAHFSSMVDGLAGGVPTVKEAKLIADFVNKATGRGDLKGFENAAGGLAAVFFSPKFVVSRFQLIYGLIPTAIHTATGFQFVPADMRRAKKQVAKEYARFLVGTAAVYGLTALAKAGFGDDDDDMELDPRSSAFGKIKIGNTWIDPMGGLLQAATFSSRMLPTMHNGEIGPFTKTKSGVVSLWRPGFGKSSYAGVLGSFLHSKVSPVPGMWINIMQGEDLVGNPTDTKAEMLGAVLPLALGDVYETMNEQGITKGAPLAVLALLGLGVQNRNDKLDLEQQIAVWAGASPGDYTKKKPASSPKLKLPKLKL